MVDTDLVYGHGLHAGRQVHAHVGHGDPQLPARGVAVPGVPATLAANLRQSFVNNNSSKYICPLVLKIFVHCF